MSTPGRCRLATGRVASHLTTGGMDGAVPPAAAVRKGRRTQVSPLGSGCLWPLMTLKLSVWCQYVVLETRSNVNIGQGGLIRVKYCIRFF